MSDGIPPAEARRLERFFDLHAPIYDKYLEHAEVKAIRAGLMSQPDAIAARGDDWRQLLAEQAEFFGVADDLELVLDTDPRKTSQGGNVQGDKPGAEAAKDTTAGADSAA